MTAPTETAVEVVDQPAGEELVDEIRVHFPLLAIENYDTADGRFITAGALTARALPLTLLAVTRSSHGGQQPEAAHTVGRIDHLERVPGPDVISRVTGEPFPEGSFVWRGSGVVSTTKEIDGDNIADLIRRRYVRGVSADLVPSDYEMYGDDALAPEDAPTRRAAVHKADLSGATILPIPAFGDCCIEVADTPAVEVAPDPAELGLVASTFPSWRSAEVGDYPALTAAGEAHTGGMIALIPADPDALTVEGGDPAEQIHLTLAYLGDDVAGWPEEGRATLLAEMDELINGDGENDLRDPAPIEARVMGHALFNPDGGPDGDREPCAVYLIGDAPRVSNLHRIIRGIVEHKVGVPEQHDPAIFHVTAGYGLDLSALSFTGPVTFDRLRVALGEDVTDFPLGGQADEAPPVEEAVVAAADTPDLPEIADEPGTPDAPQHCKRGDHPAIRSFVFDQGTRYLSSCAEHDLDLRTLIEHSGATVTSVVEIKEDQS